MIKNSTELLQFLHTTWGYGVRLAETLQRIREENRTLRLMLLEYGVDLSDENSFSASACTNRKRRHFTTHEVEALVRGVNTYGEGRWSKILEEAEFDGCRSRVCLKDKWRHLKRRNLVYQLENGSYGFLRQDMKNIDSRSQHSDNCDAEKGAIIKTEGLSDHSGSL